MKTGRKNKNKGFTLVEIIVVISIFVVLLGVLVPSLNSILGFRVQRATHSIGAALDKTKREAMNRLVGEMVLERKEDGFYISYYLDRGKLGETSGSDRVKQDQGEKIAPASTHIKIKKTGDAEAKEMVYDKVLGKSEKLILTYNREDGSFRPVQTDVLTQKEIQALLQNSKDIEFKDAVSLGDGSKVYCEEIEISGGFRKRTIKLNQATGTYTITAG